MRFFRGELGLPVNWRWHQGRWNMFSLKLKSVVLYLKLITCFLLPLPFGTIYSDNTYGKSHTFTINILQTVNTQIVRAPCDDSLAWYECLWNWTRQKIQGKNEKICFISLPFQSYDREETIGKKRRAAGLEPTQIRANTHLSVSAGRHLCFCKPSARPVYPEYFSTGYPRVTKLQSN